MHRKIMILSIPTAFALLCIMSDAQTPASPGTGAPSGSSMILNIDPVTGAIVEQASSGTDRLPVSADLAERWSTSDEGLVEQPNPSGRQGMYVNLQGRFESSMVGTVKADGTLGVPCAQGLNTAADKPVAQN